jgi:hypothetical protein
LLRLERAEFEQAYRPPLREAERKEKPQKQAPIHHGVEAKHMKGESVEYSYSA